jgi:hypothetical protein
MNQCDPSKRTLESCCFVEDFDENILSALQKQFDLATNDIPPRTIYNEIVSGMGNQRKKP